MLPHSPQLTTAVKENLSSKILCCCLGYQVFPFQQVLALGNFGYGVFIDIWILYLRLLPVFEYT